MAITVCPTCYTEVGDGRPETCAFCSQDLRAKPPIAARPQRGGRVAVGIPPTPGVDTSDGWTRRIPARRLVVGVLRGLVAAAVVAAAVFVVVALVDRHNEDLATRYASGRASFEHRSGEGRYDAVFPKAPGRVAENGEITEGVRLGSVSEVAVAWSDLAPGATASFDELVSARAALQQGTVVEERPFSSQDLRGSDYLLTVGKAGVSGYEAGRFVQVGARVYLLSAVSEKNRSQAEAMIARLTTSFRATA